MLFLLCGMAAGSKTSNQKASIYNLIYNFSSRCIQFHGACPSIRAMHTQYLHMWITHWVKFQPKKNLCKFYVNG
jgi:hypothetical protein